MHSSNLTIRKFNENDYEVLASWFANWDWSAPDLDTIPTNSYFISRDDEMIAFSCFLKTDTNTAIMGYTIANNKAKKRTEIINKLLEFIVNRAKEEGFKYIQYYTTTKSMVCAMEKQGFISCNPSKDGYILVKSLGGKNLAFFEE
jgi:N-acetylglutamate synthase-like GNAT family acetyltransferase